MNSEDIIKYKVSIYLKSTGLTPNQLSKMTGISSNLIKKYMDKTALPNLKNCCVISSVLKISLDKLLDYPDVSKDCGFF